jgi:hypothetical protein
LKRLGFFENVYLILKVMEDILLVSDLCNIYESLNQDIAELKQTRNRIPSGREYSEVLKKSITLEIEKYENLKSKLLDLEVEVPVGHPLEKISSNLDDSFYCMP